MEKETEIKTPVEEKGIVPQVKRKPCIVRTRITYKVRWEAILVFVLLCAVLLYANWRLFRDLNHTIENIYKTDGQTDKGNVRVLDVHRLRFQMYLRDFGKTYHGEEYERRFQNFKASLKEITRLNRLENNTVYGLTKFSDMSREEFAERNMLSKSNPLPLSCLMKLNCATDMLTILRPAIRINLKDNLPRSFKQPPRVRFFITRLM